MKFDSSNPQQIISYAQRLKDKSLRIACDIEIVDHGYTGKGNFGQILEKYYFGYEPNSVAEPDFKEAGIELKSSPLKKLQNGEYRSKERLVLNIINYLEVHQEEFETSSFWKKNAHLLLVFYLYEEDTDVIDYLIKLIGDWRFPNEDLLVIKHDWEKINQKIKTGNAHELSEGDTFYLGACTKGSTAESSLREQPFNSLKAKQRAYSLKQGYVNHIIATLGQSEKATYGKLIKAPDLQAKTISIEDIVISKFKPYYGYTVEAIETAFGLQLNRKAKSYFANLTNAVLGIELGQKIEEFQKADIQVKTVRLKPNNLPKEDISFPTFKYEELVSTSWDDSDFKAILESKFFFVFYRIEDKNLILKEVKFWNMPSKDFVEAKEVWENTIEMVKNGLIVRSISERGDRLSYFPKKSENRVCHVRPHARNAEDTYPLPTPDKLTGFQEFTKHCFWLNASYVKSEIVDENDIQL